MSQYAQDLGSVQTIVNQLNLVLESNLEENSSTNYNYSLKEISSIIIPKEKYGMNKLETLNFDSVSKTLIEQKNFSKKNF